MEKQSLIKATLAVLQDAQYYKLLFHWDKTTVEIYSNYIEAEYHITKPLRSIPESHANKWRIYACNDEIILVLTYDYKDDI